MKTFSITLALMCCFIYSLAQFSNPIQLKGSWEISAIENLKENGNETRYLLYLNQRVHFCENQTLILENEQGLKQLAGFGPGLDLVEGNPGVGVPWGSRWC